MRSGVAGRVFALVGLAASLASACGGHSQRLAENDGSAGDPSGDSGGTGSGAGGVIAVGGTPEAGGTSSGGASNGGITATGGVGATGGTEVCADCPAADYGVTVHGDGAARVMSYNGTIFDHSITFCADTPLRGSVSGCRRSVELWACQDALNGTPCLEVHGSNVYYVRDTEGIPWVGTVVQDLPRAAPPGVASGTLTVDVSSNGVAMTLTVDYTLCAPQGAVLIPC